MIPRDWEEFFQELHRHFLTQPPPSVSLLSRQGWNPFQLLVSTVLSLRTRDPVTLERSRALFSQAADPSSLLGLPRARLEEIIYPVGFYRQKARQIQALCRILLTEYDGQVPQTREELTALPGVGLKTANLVLGQAFGIPAICVDTHVHRITNRMGWHSTRDADQSEASLRRIVPRQYWIQLNEEMVIFGQQTCTPQSPWCSRCFYREECPRLDVQRSR